MSLNERGKQAVSSLTTALLSTKRIAQTTVATGLLMLLTNPAAAACGPNNTTACNASMSGFEAMLNNLFQVVMTALQYMGFIAFVGGLVLWFTARRSSSRAQYGSWLLVGGIVMLIIRFGFDMFISLLKFIAG